MERINPNDYDVGTVVGTTKNGNDIRVQLFNGRKIVCTDKMLGKLKMHAAGGRVYGGSGEFDDVYSAISTFEDQKKAENERDAEMLNVANEVQGELVRKKGRHQQRVTNLSDNVIMDWDEIVKRCASLLFTVNDLSEWVNENRDYLTDRHRANDLILRKTAEKMALRLMCSVADITRKTPPTAPTPEPVQKPEQMEMELDSVEDTDEFDLPYVEGIVHFPIEKDRKKFEAIIHALDVPVNNALTMAFVQWFMDMSEKSIDELAEMLEV